MHVLVATYNTS